MFSEQSRRELQALRPGKRNRLVSLLLLYVFKGCVQQDIRAFIEDNGIDFDLLHWRRHLHRNGEFLLSAKVYAYAYFCSRRFNDRSYRQDSSLLPEDLAALRRAVTEPEVWGLLDNLAAQGRPVWDEEGLRGFFQSVLSSSDYTAFVRSFIFGKLNFLITIFNDTRDGLAGDLNTWALFALMKAYPNIEDMGHGLAIAKTTVHNRGINIIKERRASGRDRSVHWHVNLDTCFNGTAPDQASPTGFSSQPSLSVGPDGTRSIRDYEIHSSLENLKVSTNLPANVRKAIRLLTGEFDEGFSNVLGRPNTDAVEVMQYSTYWKAVMRYTQLDSRREGELKSFLCRTLS